MPHPPHAHHPPRPPFSPAHARAARLRIGLSPEQTAAAMAQLGLHRPPAAVLAWEQGTRAPSEPELFALASALWCPVAELMALSPRSLREHRLARQFTADRLAERIGMDPTVYARTERDHRWSGTNRQTLLLAEALGMEPDELLRVIRRAGDLDALLRQAVEGRWKQHTAALARVVDAPERTVARALRTLHQEHARFHESYLGHVVARSDDARLREIATERAAWLRDLTRRFLALVTQDTP
ncbi:helix-turn-helix transcriptional regulator [Streptomyces roseicoloratus]|uniref:Helix-turn-helix transcriptional regulator n=1 Tax=Streptomyces roseicoloratus TaxID=2508722 RepID=A0ABY9S5U8_9ACTN|nr:helix-turn-helix transcriptional regulator [Streptomyces roseicoloratus]WMX48360.1 helix-turn-helix transcriptional regulator [Streptomyces roseicoloratus]